MKHRFVQSYDLDKQFLIPRQFRTRGIAFLYWKQKQQQTSLNYISQTQSTVLIPTRRLLFWIGLPCLFLGLSFAYTSAALAKYEAIPVMFKHGYLMTSGEKPLVSFVTWKANECCLTFYGTYIRYLFEIIAFFVQECMEISKIILKGHLWIWIGTFFILFVKRDSFTIPEQRNSLVIFVLV
jgi:hypothetical protein